MMNDSERLEALEKKISDISSKISFLQKHALSQMSPKILMQLCPGEQDTETIVEWLEVHAGCSGFTISWWRLNNVLAIENLTRPWGKEGIAKARNEWSSIVQALTPFVEELNDIIAAQHTGVSIKKKLAFHFED